MTTTGKRRLPAAERRQAIVEAALRVFVDRSYAGTTTAEIARQAGVSEPILYRHFRSKRDLFFACLDRAWADLREAWNAKMEELGERDAVGAIGRTALGLRQQRVLLPNLWVQALSEAGVDPVIRTHLHEQMREVHAFVAAAIRTSQAAGGVAADRDAEAEAWIFVAGGLLISVADRLGGVLGHEDFTAIATQRYRWLTGRSDAGP
jgi:AcrR family transcriptional regulator